MHESPKVIHRSRRLAAVIILSAVAVLAPTLGIPAGAVQSPLPGPISGWKTVAGTDGRTYMADAQGRALQLRGFNIKTDDPDVATDELLAAAAERGMDHLRLTVFWDALEPTEGNFDEAYIDKIVAALDRAQARGILVILDMHQDVFGPAFGSRGIPTWATRTDGLPFEEQEVWLLNYMQPAVQRAFNHLYEDADLRQFQIRAWMQIVNRVKSHPAILGYDLLNEPFGEFRPGEDLPTAAARVEREQLTPMFQRLTDAISAVDPDHWVMFEPPNLASIGIPTSLGPVMGPKVAFYPHMYDPAVEAATYTPGGTIVYNPEFFGAWAKAITPYPMANHLPMLVGEWGIAHPEADGMDSFVKDSMRVLDEVGMGWSMFNWCKGGGYCPLDTDGNDRPSIGRIFAPYARAIAGAPTSSVWNPDSAELKVIYSDNAATGNTQIFLPVSRTYPNGYTVEASDPTGSWSHSFDASTGVLSVTVPDTGGAHAICVKPEGAPVGCAVPVAPTTTTTTARLGTTPGNVSPRSYPSVAAPRFTG